MGFVEGEMSAQPNNKTSATLRVSRLPLVRSALQSVTSAYSEVKGRYPLLGLMGGVANVSLLMAMRQAMPLLQSLEPQIEVANSFALVGLDHLERNFPILNQSTEEVMGHLKDAIRLTLDDMQLWAVDGMDSVLDQLERLSDAVMHLLLHSQVGQAATLGLDDIMCRLEDAAAYYLPLPPTLRREWEMKVHQYEDEDEGEEPSLWTRIRSLLLSFSLQLYHRMMMLSEQLEAAVKMLGDVANTVGLGQVLDLLGDLLQYLQSMLVVLVYQGETLRQLTISRVRGQAVMLAELRPVRQIRELPVQIQQLLRDLQELSKIFLQLVINVTPLYNMLQQPSQQEMEDFLNQEDFLCANSSRRSSVNSLFLKAMDGRSCHRRSLYSRASRGSLPESHDPHIRRRPSLKQDQGEENPLFSSNSPPHRHPSATELLFAPLKQFISQSQKAFEYLSPNSEDKPDNSRGSIPNSPENPDRRSSLNNPEPPNNCQSSLKTIAPLNVHRSSLKQDLDEEAPPTSEGVLYHRPSATDLLPVPLKQFISQSQKAFEYLSPNSEDKPDNSFGSIPYSPENPDRRSSLNSPEPPNNRQSSLKTIAPLNVHRSSLKQDLDEEAPPTAEGVSHHRPSATDLLPVPLKQFVSQSQNDFEYLSPNSEDKPHNSFGSILKSAENLDRRSSLNSLDPPNDRRSSLKTTATPNVHCSSLKQDLNKESSPTSDGVPRRSSATGILPMPLKEFVSQSQNDFEYLSPNSEDKPDNSCSSIPKSSENPDRRSSLNSLDPPNNRRSSLKTTATPNVHRSSLKQDLDEEVSPTFEGVPCRSSPTELLPMQLKQFVSQSQNHFEYLSPNSEDKPDNSCGSFPKSSENPDRRSSLNSIDSHNNRRSSLKNTVPLNEHGSSLKQDLDEKASPTSDGASHRRPSATELLLAPLKHFISQKTIEYLSPNSEDKLDEPDESDGSDESERAANGDC